MDPADDEMRKQMFKSLVALEKMCDAVTAHLAVRPPEQSEAPEETSSAQESIDKMGGVVAKHHKALALLATFGMMKDRPTLGSEPSGEIARLLGMKACRNCVGTGWVARDETCGECNRSGFLTA